MHFVNTRFFSTILSATACAVTAFASPHSRAEIADDATAILQTKCWTCHGPTRQRGDLRLDSLEFIQTGGKSDRAAAEAGKSVASLLLEKVTESNPQKRMPASGPPLTKDEVDILSAWIDEGMAWPEHLPEGGAQHWAFVAPENPDVPTVAEQHEAINPIDNFLLNRLDREELTPANEADRYTLVRRASLELTGLPPTPEEVLDFVNDDSLDAYDRLLDRLFASPHYGERQARRWLDAARYADTNGYEKDRPRSIWPWRDWVIQAYNDNMPYDQFVTEQLAGDLLPDATESQRVATGFHRNTMFNEEGGIDAAEDWYKRTLDRTNTVGTLFLGLTVSCAQCHNHKFDPMSQREYYRMFAFFNDAQEATLSLADPKIDARRAEQQHKIDELAEEMLRQAKRNNDIEKEFEAWVQEASSKAGTWTIDAPERAVSEKDATLELLDDGSVLATGDIPNDDTYVLEFDDVKGPITAFRLEVLPHESLPGGGPGRGTILAEGDFLLSGLETLHLGADGSEAPIAISGATHSFAAENRSAEQALDGKPDTGWSINGGTGQAHRAVYEFSEALPAGSHRIKLKLHQDYIHQHTLGRFRVSWTHEAAPKAAMDLPAKIEEYLVASREKLTTSQTDVLLRYFALEKSETLERQRKQRRKLQTSMPKYTTTLVMTPRTPARTTRLYTRGEFLKPRREVEPGTPNVLHEFQKVSSMDRVAFAQWLSDPANPLMARVAVNRLWQQVFGTGIVSTPEDFGTQGARPSHPDLLDWLAVTFIESGWNMKALHRLMVSSAAFRRDSGVSAENLDRDPNNRLLTRGPYYRLQAEVIRDIALSASGLLNPDIGGPSVYPPQPEGVGALGYQDAGWPTSTGADRHRRGLYTYLRRTTPYAGFQTFDAPTSEEACVRRERSNTPLQSLTLLNDRVFNEAAQAMAMRLTQYLETTDHRLDALYLAFLGRYPNDAEREQIATFYEKTLERLSRDEARARKVAGPAGFLSPKDPPEVAAWAAVSRVVLNLDETISQR